MYFKHSKVDLGGMVREVGWDFVKVRERERERERRSANGEEERVATGCLPW